MPQAVRSSGANSIGLATGMTTLVLSQSDVRALLPIDACIELMAEALGALARGAATNPLRRGMLLPHS